MRQQTGELRYKFIFACTIWILKKKELSFCNNLFICKNHSLCIRLFSKIMHLSQLFFYMLTLTALTKLNVTDCYGSDLNVYMNQYH